MSGLYWWNWCKSPKRLSTPLQETPWRQHHLVWVSAVSLVISSPSLVAYSRYYNLFVITIFSSSQSFPHHNLFVITIFSSSQSFRQHNATFTISSWYSSSPVSPLESHRHDHYGYHYQHHHRHHRRHHHHFRLQLLIAGTAYLAAAATRFEADLAMHLSLLYTSLYAIPACRMLGHFSCYPTKASASFHTVGKSEG